MGNEPYLTYSNMSTHSKLFVKFCNRFIIIIFLNIPDSSSEEFPRKGTPPVLPEAVEAPAATDDIPSAEIEIDNLSDF